MSPDTATKHKICPFMSIADKEQPVNYVHHFKGHCRGTDCMLWITSPYNTDDGQCALTINK